MSNLGFIAFKSRLLRGCLYYVLYRAWRIWGSPVEVLAVISKFEFCSVTAFGIELVIAAFVSVGGEMWTLVVELFDGRGAHGAQFVCGQDFGCDGVIGRVALMSPQKEPSSVSVTWLPESPLMTGRAAAGHIERMAMSGSFFIVSAIVVEIMRSSFSSFKTSSSRSPFKIVSLDCSAITVEWPKSWINSWAKENEGSLRKGGSPWQP